MENIIVTKRTADYHACLTGQPGIWGCGKSISEAIGDLVQSHAEKFSIKVTLDLPNPNEKLKAPAGKIRVVGVDLFDHTDYIVGDYDDCENAFAVADKHNEARSGSMDDVYYVYDDTGKFIHGNNGKEKVTP